MRGVSRASSLSLFTGCIKGIVPHLPELVHYLIDCLSNSRVRGGATPHRTCTALLRSRRLLRFAIFELCPFIVPSLSHISLPFSSLPHLLLAIFFLSLTIPPLPCPLLCSSPSLPLSSSPPSSLRPLFVPSHAGHSAALPSG